MEPLLVDQVGEFVVPNGPSASNLESRGKQQHNALSDELMLFHKQMVEIKMNDTWMAYH